VQLSYLPLFVTVLLKGMPIAWKNRHKLVFCWVIMIQAIGPDLKTVKGLSRWSASYITEWRIRRLLKAAYWSIDILITWFAEETIKSFPPPENGVVYFVGDGSHKDKRGKKNPTVQKGKTSKTKPWYFGIRFILVVLCWDTYRIPVAFRIILPKTHPDYKTEGALFREIIEEYEPPAWAKKVIVIGDAGYSSKVNMKSITEKNKSDSKSNWYYVFALARTWKKEDGKSIKDFVLYLPRKFYKATWIPSITNTRRKCFLVYSKVVSLRDVGEVTMVLSKKGRNAGLKNTKIIVTNLPRITARQVIDIYQRRWPVEIVFKELKSGLGLGEHQVTKEEHRVKNSLGIAIIAYLFLLRACRDDIKPGQSWSIFKLQNNFRIRIFTNQVQHTTRKEMKKFIK